jgi:hypothetical protein
MKENIWILRRPLNGLPSEQKFGSEEGLRSMLDPIAWQGLNVGFEVIRPDGHMLTGGALELWYNSWREPPPDT